MKTLIKKKTTINKKDNLIILCKKNSNLSQYNLSSKEQDFIKKEKGEIITINQYNRYIFIVKPKENSNLDFYNENCRLIGDKLIERKALEDATIDRARDHPEDAVEKEDFDAPEGDAFEEIYKGEVSKSGQPILPSKRSRKVPQASRPNEDQVNDDDDDDSLEDNPVENTEEQKD